MYLEMSNYFYFAKMAKIIPRWRPEGSVPNLLCSSQLCSLSLLTMRLSCYTEQVVLDFKQ